MDETLQAVNVAIATIIVASSLVGAVFGAIGWGCDHWLSKRAPMWLRLPGAAAIAFVGLALVAIAYVIWGQSKNSERVFTLTPNIYPKYRTPNIVAGDACHWYRTKAWQLGPTGRNR